MKSAIGFTTFDTSIGVCGVAWSDDGLVGVQLPAGDAGRVTDRLRRRFRGASEQAASAFVAKTIADIQALLTGVPVDFADTTLDSREIPEFNRRVYSITRRVLAGATTTYGAIAAELGDPTVARAVGRAMGQNPVPLVVPCHRVLAAGGHVGGFTATGGIDTKLRLLRIEGAAIAAQLGLFEAGLLRERARP